MSLESQPFKREIGRVGKITEDGGLHEKPDPGLLVSLPELKDSKILTEFAALFSNAGGDIRSKIFTKEPMSGELVEKVRNYFRALEDERIYNKRDALKTELQEELTKYWNSW